MKKKELFFKVLVTIIIAFVAVVVVVIFTVLLVPSITGLAMLAWEEPDLQFKTIQMISMILICAASLCAGYLASAALFLATKETWKYEKAGSSKN